MCGKQRHFELEDTGMVLTCQLGSRHSAKHAMCLGADVVVFFLSDEEVPNEVGN
jgi:hypothetical protein